MPKVFISYRREDTSAPAKQIYNELVKHFHPSDIFMDVDSIEYGKDFVASIEKHIILADIVLVLIGPSWNGSPGEHRLLNPKDFVLLEIELSIRHQKQVIPILVGSNTQFPKQDELPPTLSTFNHKNAFLSGVPISQAELNKIVQLVSSLSRSSETSFHSAEAEHLLKEQAAHIRETLRIVRIQCYSLSTQMRNGSVLISGSSSITKELSSRFVPSDSQQEFWRYLNDDKLILSVAVVGWEASPLTKNFSATVHQIKQCSPSLNGNLGILLYPVELLTAIVDDAYSPMVFVNIFSAIREAFHQKYDAVQTVNTLTDALTLELQGNAATYVVIRYEEAIKLINDFIKEVSDILLSLGDMELVQISKADPKIFPPKFTRTDTMKAYLDELQGYITVTKYNQLLTMVDNIAESISKDQAAKKIHKPKE